MKKIFLFIVVIIAIFFFTLFSNKGNELLKPQIQNYLQAQMENNESIELQEFNLSLGEFSALVIYNKNTKLKINGDYSSLFKSFDMQYHLLSDNFKYKKISIKEHLDITGRIEGELSDKILHFQGNAHNELGDLDFEKSTYNLKEKILESDYLLYLNDLSKLKRYTKQNLEGNISIQGHLKKDNVLIVQGKTNDLDGLLEFKLKENKLFMKMQKVSAQKIMAMLHYPQIFKAFIIGDLTYNIKEKKGQIQSQLDSVQLLPNTLTNIIKKLNGFDISQENFTNSQFNAKIHEQNIIFEFYAKNNNTNLTISEAYLNNKQKTINARYNIAINGKDVGGMIDGSIHNPDVTIDSSQYIRAKVTDVINKNSETLKNIGIGEEEQKKVKDFFDSLFK